mmetsp:Transcript_18318/g.29943  ORF Transcript_18318/g.29943 Transcript_18318/m.29943 type:complete len:87 (-) Transcript_18318:749-1009(-)
MDSLQKRHSDLCVHTLSSSSLYIHISPLPISPYSSVAATFINTSASTEGKTERVTVTHPFWNNLVPYIRHCFLAVEVDSLQNLDLL